MSATGEIACAALAPNWRRRYMIPLIHTTTRIPACAELPITRLKIVGIQAPGPSSVAAVIHIAIQMIRNSGRPTWATISPSGTPAAFRSVAGNCCPITITA